MGLDQKQLAQKTMSELAGLKLVVGDRGRAQVDREIRRRDQLSRKKAVSIRAEGESRWFGRNGPEGDEEDLRELLEPFSRSMAHYASHGLDLTWLTILGEPRPKERPRFGGGRVFSSKTQMADQKRLQHGMSLAFDEPLDGTIAIACLFYRSTQHHVDVDNLLKQVMDAAKGIIWHDDAQVTASWPALEVDREYPRIAIGVVPYQCSVRRVQK